MLIKIRVPKDGPLAGFLEMDILERADYLRPCIETDEDRDFDTAARVIREGWHRDRGTLHFDSQHARIVLDAIVGGINCLDDEVEHDVQRDRELIAINKSLIAAGNRMQASILKQLRGGESND